MKDLTLEEKLDIIKETAKPIKDLAGRNDLVDFLYSDAFHITFNANDLFAWGTADSVNVSIEDLPKLLEVRALFGHDGVNAFLSLVDGSEVQKPFQTDIYKQAKQFLKNYRPCSWVH